jgi:Flp pilus assembly protein TadG
MHRGNSYSEKLLRRRAVRKESGQTLLEVALLTPLLLTMLLGVIDLGRYAYIAILVGNAAHAGAAYGAQGLAQSADTSGIQQAAINDYQNNGQPAGSLTVSSFTSCACDNGGTLSLQTNACSTQSNPSIANTIQACQNGGGHWAIMVSVTAGGTYTSLVGWPGIPSPVTINRTAIMRVSN